MKWFSIFRIASQFMTFVVVPIYLYLICRYIRLYRELRDRFRNLMPDYVSLLAEASLQACFLCAAASGKATARITVNDGPETEVEVEEEQGGWHGVNDASDGEMHRVPCMAFALRSRSREIIEVYMKTATTAKRNWFQVLSGTGMGDPP